MSWAAVHALETGQAGRNLGRTFFRAPLNVSGERLLPRNLTINGIAVPPSLWYNAHQISGSTWTPEFGDALTEAGGGSLGLDDGSPVGVGGGDDTSVLYDGTGYHINLSALHGFGADDFVIELLLRFANVNAYVLAGESGSLDSWRIRALNNTIYVNVRGSANVASPVLGEGTWNHIVIGADRSSNAQVWANTAAGSAVSISAQSASLVEHGLAVGANLAGGFPNTGAIGYIAAWHMTGLDLTELATIVDDRFYRLAGGRPTLACGAAAPTVATRATVAYLRKDTSSVAKYFLMGAGWVPRIGQRGTRTGPELEPLTTNIVTNPDDIGAAGWAASNCTVGRSNATGPDGELSADTITEDGIASWKRVQRNISPVAATQYAFWAIMRKPTGGRDYAMLRVFDNNAGASLVRQNFTLISGGAINDSSGSPDAAYIVDLGGGWVLAIVIKTTAAVVTTHTIYVSPADGTTTTSDTYTGDSRDATEVWWVQGEIGSYATSPCDGTRNADVLSYARAGNVPAEGARISADVFAENYDAVGSTFFLVSVNDGTLNNRFAMYVEPAAAALGTFIADGGVTQANVTGTTDLFDGTQRSLESDIHENDVRQRVDGTEEGTPDTSADIPTGLTDLDIANNANGGGQPVGVLGPSNVEIRR